MTSAMARKVKLHIDEQAIAPLYLCNHTLLHNFFTIMKTMSLAKTRGVFAAIVLIVSCNVSAESWQLISTPQAATKHYLDTDSIDSTQAHPMVRFKVVWKTVKKMNSVSFNSVIVEMSADCKSKKWQLQKEEQFMDGILVNTLGPRPEFKEVPSGSYSANMIAISCGHETVASIKNKRQKAAPDPKAGAWPKEIHGSDEMKR